MLTQERLKEVLNYNPETGIFTRNTWIDNRGRIFGIRKIGTITHGYMIITIDGKHHRGARLAWLYMTGSLPTKHIDHIDGNRSNDAWNNLREVTISENNQNYRKARASNKTGCYIGVSMMPPSKDGYIRRKPYRARINNTTIGYFQTQLEAYEAYVNEKRKLHPFGTL